MLEDIVLKTNDAIGINAPTGTDIHLTSHGSDWMWAVFCVFAVFTIYHGFSLAFSKSNGFSMKKFLNLVPLYSNAVLGFTYFVVASNLGWAGVPVEFDNIVTSEGLGIRQIFYARYIGWFLAFPCTIVALELASTSVQTTYETQTSLIESILELIGNLVIKVLVIEVLVLGLLVGSVIQSLYKWAFFAFATAGDLFVVFLIIRNQVRNRKDITGLNHSLICLELISIVLYPVAWGLSYGGNVIQPDSEAVFFGVIDLITFCFVPSLLNILNRKDADSGLIGKLIHSEKLHSSPRPSGDTAV